MIAFTCPSCRKSLAVDDYLAGKRVQCPGCGRVAAVAVPDASSSSPADAGAPTRTAPSRSVERWRVDALSAEHDPRLTAFLAPPQAQDELGRLGKYRILQVLGHGGMGVVFQAEDPLLGRLVALKAMLPEMALHSGMKERFLREAKAAAAVEHDHIIPIHEVNEDRGVPFLAMPYLQGASLESWLRQGNAPTERQTLKLAREIARGLAAAHRRGLIHRDVKPANLWLDGAAGGRVKILDFGLARLAGEQNLTQTGAILGTPSYMAPEQARGEKVDARADLFSLGVVLYRLCTGELPFKGNDTLSVLTALAVDNPAPPHIVKPSVSRPLSDVVMNLLEKDPARRPCTAEEVLEALQRLESESPRQEKTGSEKEATSDSSPGQADRGASRPAPRRRRLALLVGVLALLTGMIGVAGWAVTGRASKHGGEGTDQPWDGKTAGKHPLAAPEKGWPREIENGIGMKLVRIPPGAFTMGSPPGEEGHDNDEGQHEVKITREFWLGVHEVTQKQFKAVMGYNPSFFSRDGKGKEGVAYGWKPAGGKDKAPADTKDFPVENVSWEEAREFCAKLSNRAEEKRRGRKYRLPSEAEWEYACRGGAPFYQVFHFGASLSSRQANFDVNHPYGGPARETPLNRPCNVGSYAKNRFGLFDMHGNVYEWCEDWYGADYYGKGPPSDPPGPSEGVVRVFRGGGWNSPGAYCRSADRHGSAPGRPYGSLGFRVALVPSGR
jgi:serine/threonine protein kinase